MDWVILISIAILFIMVYSKGYFTKKGENLATKQDIEALTRKVESIKHEYAQDLESLRMSLSSQQQIFHTRYNKEFEILQELSGLLVDLRDAAQSLRPVMDYVDVNKSEKEIKSERLRRYDETMRNLYSASEKKRPFYPEEIYQIVKKFHETTWKEAVDYGWHNKTDGDYWQLLTMQI